MNRNDNTLPPKRLSAKVSGEVIDALGGTNAVAKLCGIRPASVSLWRTDGIPRAWTLFLRERFKTLPVMRDQEISSF